MNPLMKLGIAGHVKLYRSTNGKMGSHVGEMPVLLLTTTGRKSGKARTVPVVFMQEDDRRYIAASAAGADKHPAWFLNLRDNGDVEGQSGAETFAASAVITDGDERRGVWERLFERYDQFAGYQKKTTRVIPVVRLDRKGS